MKSWVQPAQVRAYAIFVRRRAKTDTIDAALIADPQRRSRKPFRRHPIPGWRRWPEHHDDRPAQGGPRLLQEPPRRELS